jgi:hypothetical protein
MHSYLARYICRLGVMGLALAGLALSAHAQTSTYSDQATFLAHVQPGYYLETFDTQPLNSPVDSPLSFSSNGFSYTASVPDVQNSSGGFDPGSFFNVGTSSDVWLSTNLSQDTITFNFTSGNVTAVGGNFFNTDVDGNVSNGTIDLLLSDGTSLTLTNPTDTTFAGFTSGQTITSLMVTPIAPTNPDGSPLLDSNGNPVVTWATVNNLIVGAALPTTSATPEPGATALLVGMGATGLVALRRYRKARPNKRTR